MPTEKPENSQPVVDLEEEVNISQSSIITNQRSNWGLWLGAIALFAGGTMVWRSLNNSPQSMVQNIGNLEQARLTVKTVPADLEPIQAWSYGDGFANAVVKKHLNFQAEEQLITSKKLMVEN